MMPWQLLGAGAPLGVSAVVACVVGPPVVSADRGLSVRYTTEQPRATHNRSGNPLLVWGLRLRVKLTETVRSLFAFAVGLVCRSPRGIMAVMNDIHRDG
jgi:hypothetical protein